MNRPIFILLLFTIIVSNSFCQTQFGLKKSIDSIGEIVSKNPIEAKSNLIPLIESSESISFSTGVFLGHKFIGTSNLYLGKMDSAQIAFKKAIEFESDIEPIEKASLRNNLALALQKMGELDESLKYYNESLFISRAINDSIGIARTCFNIGTYYRGKGQFNYAINYLDESLKFYTLLNEKKATSQVLNSLGLIQKSMKNYKGALDFFYESLQINTDLNDLKGVMDIENNIAATCIDKKEYEPALIHQKTSLLLAEQMGNGRMMAGSYANLGIIYKELENRELALQNYSKAIDLFEQMKDNIGLLSCYTNLGLLQIEEEQFKKAESNLLKGKFIAQKLKSIESVIKINRGLSDVYSKTGKFKLAFDNYIQMDLLTDSIFNLESAKQIADIQEKYETTKKNKEIQELKLNSVLSEKSSQIQSQNMQLLIVALIAIFMITLFLIARISYRKRLFNKEKEQLELKEQIAQREIELKNKRLTAFAAETLHKNQFIEELNLLIDGIKVDSKISDNHLKKYKDLLVQNRQEESNWKTFKVHFENVHPDFFRELEKLFPKFTQNDFRICAYIKMGLVNKEIASLMNIAPTSVKMAKTRLKKKMNLGEKDNLSEVINTI